jgi:hypothetical protein
VKDPVESKQKKLLQRLKELGISSAAAIGAFSSLADSAPQSRPDYAKKSPEASPLIQISSSNTFTPTLQYAQSFVLGKSASFLSHALSGVAVDHEDKIYVLGDGQVFIFSPGGDFIRKWKAPEGAICLTVSPDKRIWIGTSGRVAIYADDGNQLRSFAVGDAARPARITSIKILNNQILIADAAARHIRRYDLSGKQTGELGTKGQPGFMLPNGSLDIAVDGKGMVWATDPGRHRVSSWNSEGLRIGYFGKFGQQNVENFVGCCNPVNLAIAPDGKIVTGEKVTARVKVFDADGKLLALIGPEHFDQNNKHLHLAVDSKGRIIVADPVRLELKIFSPDIKSGAREIL